mgnify:CR=1 FL=1
MITRASARSAILARNTMPEVLIHTNTTDALLRSAAQQVFVRILGWSVHMTTEAETARTSALPVIAYGDGPIGSGFRIAALSGDDALADPFRDPIRFTSVMLTTWQGSGATDEHGRSRTHELLVHRKGWIDRPIVDEVVLDLARRLQAVLPGLPPVRRTYRHIATLDVDNGFKYLGRPVWRTIGSAARDLLHGRMGELKDRAATLLGARPDPYDAYDHFHEVNSGNADRTITNFLVAPHGKFDHAVGLSSRRMIRRMQAIAQWSDVGLHPSYFASEKPQLFAKEKAALEAAIAQPVFASRQHFLRFRSPETFLELERIGIKEDHSIGLHDAIGFRAGTCTPFPFYDVENDRETALMIVPFQVMASARADKMKLTPDEAIAAGKQVIDKVKAVQGTFIGVWHERFISDHGAEKGWRRVVEETIRYAKP